MSDNGFVLERIETYNWGNFQKWQFAEVSKPGPEGSLFGPERINALLLGINGAGKSTLIDALIITLLPFEQAVKLGVIHDLEKGSASGRNISSYVLGKHGSTGEAEFDPKRVYSRDSGSSATLLCFRHRSDPSRKVTVGRIWWYAGHKLREDSAGFVGLGNFSLGPNEWGAEALLDADGRSYRSFKDLKLDVQRRKLSLQVFDRNNSYFQAMSSIFGGVSKDDLKLLNRAFYMKSIEQIDSFIREHMLVEGSNESMKRLVEHVAQASQITRNIEECETKLRRIEEILRELQRYQDLSRRRANLESKSHLLGIYPDWIGLRELTEKITSLRSQALIDGAQLPAMIAAEESLQQELERIIQLIAQDDVASSIRELELRRAELQRQIVQGKANQESVQSLCERLELKAPLQAKSLDRFKTEVSGLSKSLEEKRETETTRSRDLAVRLNDVGKQSTALRAEIQHLSEHPTQIESGLYSIKTDCIEELGIPADALSFVGELIAVRKGEEGFELAIEAALHPISRNILCHPDFLEKVTRWLNHRGLSRSITLKRIKAKELESVLRPKFPEDCILSKIEVLPLKKNPFFDYLWAWLTQSFDHRIVDVQSLKKAEGRAVTPEGTVKSDERTLKKLKKGFDFSLGWNSEDKIQRLIAGLALLQKEETQLQSELRVSERVLKQVEAQGRDLAVLQNTELTYFHLSALEETLSATQSQIKVLEKKSQKLVQLKEEKQKAQTALHQASESRISVKNRLEQAQMEIPLLTRKLESDQRSFDECLSSKVPGLGVSLNELFDSVTAELEGIRKTLLESGKDKTWRTLQTDLQEEIKAIVDRQQQSRLSHLLKDYEAQYHDPDLHYVVPLADQIEPCLHEWNRARTDIDETGLPQARQKWVEFYNSVLFDSVKTAINEIRTEQHSIKRNIHSINAVLKLTDYERLPSENRYLQIVLDAAQDDRIRKFGSDLKSVEKILVSEARFLVDQKLSSGVMEVLEPFVKSLEGEANSGYFSYVTDVRNHYRFAVHSHRRATGDEIRDEVVEVFTGSRKDAKSSAQTTQLAYVLLASSLAYRFNFHDSLKGKDSLRLIVLDEFGGKFDNEKPKDIVRLLDDLGFQSIFVSPMSKADLLAESCGNLVFVHKASASESKMGSTAIEARPISEIQAAMQARLSGNKASKFQHAPLAN